MLKRIGFLSGIALPLLTVVSSSIAAEFTFPDLCSETEIKTKLQSMVDPKMGACTMGAIFKNQFGHPTGKFQESSSAVFECSVVGSIKFSLTSQVNARTKTCIVGKPKQTKLEGRYCGFVDDFDAKEIVARSFQLNGYTEKQVDALSDVQKKQLIVEASQRSGEGTQITAWEAFNILVDGSEGGDVYYEVYEIDGKVFNEVRSYPGGNAYGTVFADGETTPWAFNGDDDYVCALKPGY